MHPYFLLFIFATNSDAQLQTTGTIFKVDHFQDGGIFEDTKVALQIQKSLHLCSMTNNCTGIVKEEQRETLDLVSDKGHLALKEKEFFISKDRLSDAPIIFSKWINRFQFWASKIIFSFRSFRNCLYNTWKPSAA